MLSARYGRRLAAGLAGLLAVGVASPWAAAAHAAPASAVTTPGQHAYVAVVNDTSGTDTYVDSQSVILARIDAVLSRWVVESDQLISSFTRAGTVQTFDADCTKTGTYSAAWAASGTLFPGVSFSGTSGNHLIVIGPKGCGGGIGIEGSDANGLSSGGKVYLPDDPAEGTQGMLHELGHNFSLEHAHNISCDTSGNCTQEEYGDDYAIMGTTEDHTPAWVPASLDSFERTHLGVAQPCEVPSLALAAGQQSVTATYDLFGRGSSSTGTRGLAVTDPVSGVTTMLDWRDHAGRDAGAYYGSSLALAQRETYNTGLTVEQVSPDGDSTILQGHLADGASFASTKAGTYLHAYTAGQTYTAGGTTVHVNAMPAGDGTDATTQVTVTLTGSSTGNAALPVQQGTVSVSGLDTAGSVLTASPSGWTPGSCYRYQWYDNGSPVDGARAGSYTVPAASAGHQFTVAVTGQQTGFQPLTVVTAPAASPCVCAPVTTAPAAAPAANTTTGTPGFSRALFTVGDGTVTSTYRVSSPKQPTTVTLTATARGRRTVTTSTGSTQGKVTVRGLADGVVYTYTLTVSDAGGSSTTTLGRQAPSRIPHLTLTAGRRGGVTRLSGTLLLGKAAVADRTVSLTAHGRTVARVKTDRHGRFSVALSSPGTYSAASTVSLDNHKQARVPSRAVRV